MEEFVKGQKIICIDVGGDMPSDAWDGIKVPELNKEYTVRKVVQYRYNYNPKDVQTFILLEELINKKTIIWGLEKYGKQEISYYPGLFKAKQL